MKAGRPLAPAGALASGFLKVRMATGNLNLIRVTVVVAMVLQACTGHPTTGVPGPSVTSSSSSSQLTSRLADSAEYLPKHEDQAENDWDDSSAAATSHTPEVAGRDSSEENFKTTPSYTSSEEERTLSSSGGLEKPHLQDEDERPKPQEVRSLVKRSIDPGFNSYMSSVGYDPYGAFGKRHGFDPGYQSYMQSIGYDPTMAFGKRDTERDGYDSYMQSVGYDPMMAWGMKRGEPTPQLYTGYDSGKALGKHQMKRDIDGELQGFNDMAYPHHYFSGYDKRSDYYDTNYPTHFFTGGMKKSDPYLDVYIPQHFMHGFKRSVAAPYLYSGLGGNDWKRAPNEMGAQGFHEGIFTHNFGDFSPVKRNKRDANEKDLGIEKRGPEMTSSGFHGDTFSGGFGDFYTMKKRRMGMGASGFHPYTFSDGWGDFSTMKKRRPEMTSSGFHGDTFSGGFGDFYTMKKRRPEMTSSGFYGDTFSGGFGDFYTMKRAQEKRRPEMNASGFHGDTFSGGFGDFYTMKKRDLKRETSSKDDEQVSGSKEEVIVRRKREVPRIQGTDKRRLEMDSSGFHGDTFSGGFGDFYTMKRGQDKRRPEMDSSGFYGDTFHGGFGDFYTMKKRLTSRQSLLNQIQSQDASAGSGSVRLERDTEAVDHVMDDDDDLVQEDHRPTVYKRVLGMHSPPSQDGSSAKLFDKISTLRERR
ncbi:uncharacterized protein LOC143021059 [Oratosquilla oratoria]|uniref:uncharacterized protein LOC143021059 n=1 Tax=Oratosquilla oratoria TaxID=337810 RepID=UPI003F765395